MNKDRIIELLAEILQKNVAEIRNINEETDLAEIGLDSMNFIALVVNMEEEFNILVNDSDLRMENFKTVGVIFKTMGKYFNTPAPLKKVFIIDCDNVLWSGISGEEIISLGDINIRFQKELIKLYEQGVLLCLCSKNEPQNIEDAFNMPGMILKWEHITCAKINLNDKAQNIQDIAVKLNLLIDSFVFADDSDYELGLVNALLPDIDTVKVDYSDLRFIETVKSFFGYAPDQDINRTQLYKEQKEREKEKLNFKTVDEYNKSLETKYICASVSEEQIERIAELSQRTNQFNLSCRRYNADEIKQIIDSDNYSVITLSITDRYGDMGIVGAAVLRNMETIAVIDSFMISCRVFGRNFEYIMLDKIKELSCGKDLYGIYVHNEKNQRYGEFYKENGIKYYE